MSTTYILGGLVILVLLSIIAPFLLAKYNRPTPLVTLSVMPEETLADLDDRVNRYVDAAMQTKLLYQMVRAKGNSNQNNIMTEAILKEEFLQDMVVEITVSVMESFSPQYLEFLSTAIPKDKIEDYVLERVYLAVFTFSRDYNFTVLGIKGRSSDYIDGEVATPRPTLTQKK